MEGAAAFALFCGICQVVGYSLKGIQLLQQVRKEGSTKHITAAVDQAQQLEDLIGNINPRSRQYIGDASNPRTKLEVELQTAVSRCDITATKILALLRSCRSSGGWRESIRATAKTLLSKAQLQGLEKDLASQHQVLQTTILVELR
jgi:hypothetical protein